MKASVNITKETKMIVNILIFVSLLVAVLLIVENVIPRNYGRRSTDIDFKGEAVHSYKDSSEFPSIGESKTVYHSRLNNQFYRWDGENYIEYHGNIQNHGQRVQPKSRQ
jgi:hypothetical protein